MNPVNAQDYIKQHQPMKWSRSTIADGKWMQDNTLTPLNTNDEQLGIYIDKVVEGLNAEIADRSNLTEVVNEHTTEIGQIQDAIHNVNSSLTDKKDKQTELAFNGSATKTVKGITQNANGELNVEFADIDFPSYSISSSDGSINVSTSAGVTDLTLPSDVVRDSAYTHIDAATANPLMNGTAAVGISTKYAREDHVHPTDTSRASASHTHGNIANGGTLQTNDITIANGDKLVVTDSSDSSKVARASIAFDGSTTTQALTKAGTWATFNNYSHPAGSAPSKTGVPTANATPGFGDTFKVNQITTDATSHVSAVTERTITIPDTKASTSADGLMSAADKKKLDGIATGAEANVQADWNITNSSSDAFIKNKPYYTKYTTTSTYYKVCSFPATSSESVDISGLQILSRYFSGGVNGRLIYKNGFRLYYERVSDVYANTQFVKFHYVTNGSKIDLYAERNGYPTLHVAPLVNQPKSRVDFTDFGTEVSSLPEGATEITPVWVVNSARSSGTAPVKVNEFGDLTPVPMDSTPTASSKNLMTSGAIKTALDTVNAKGITVKEISGEQVICFE